MALSAISYSQTETSSQAPLTEAERREILRQLVHYESALAEVRLYKQYLEREQAIAERERASYEDRLKLAEERVEVAEKEAAAERARADFYMSAYQQLLKIQKGGCGFWGTMKRIVTVGIASCH